MLLRGKVEAREAAGQGYPSRARCGGDTWVQVFCEGYFIYLLPVGITKQGKSKLGTDMSCPSKSKVSAKTSSQ